MATDESPPMHVVHEPNATQKAWIMTGEFALLGWMLHDYTVGYASPSVVFFVAAGFAGVAGAVLTWQVLQADHGGEQ
jgi:hypothetical protein